MDSSMRTRVMRIAYPMRVDALRKAGGDVLQVRRYIEEGARAGDDGGPLFTGELMCDMRAGFKGFDLVHLTNLDRPADTWKAMRIAQGEGKPIVLSTIHHSYEEIERFERLGRGGVVGVISGRLGFYGLEHLRGLVRSVRDPGLLAPVAEVMRRGMKEAQREILAASQRVLLLSEHEREALVNDVGAVPEEKLVLLRNGMDEVTAHKENDAQASVEESGATRDVDVCVVGRIEARKNQLSILRALGGLGVRAVFLGAMNPNHREHGRRFLHEVEATGCQWVGAASHEETLGWMRRARVHVSASWFEVASLVDLEAHAAGCVVVASECGGTREVLGERAEYVDPASAESLRRAIVRALERSRARQIRENISLPTWRDVARQLAGIYREVLDEAGSAR